MKKHPDFEGAVAELLNEYEFTDATLAYDSALRADFAKYLVRKLRDMNVAFHVIGEPHAAIIQRDAELRESDAFLDGLLNPKT